jgi:hypothetical protein
MQAQANRAAEIARERSTLKSGSRKWLYATVSAAIFMGVPAAQAQVSTGVLPSGWTGSGNFGTATANGVVTTPPVGGSSYLYISTNGGVSGVGSLSGVGGNGSPTNGSTILSPLFGGTMGTTLQFGFNYVTSDGSGFADYSYARLLDESGAQTSILFTARTVANGGDTVPGFGMPALTATLSPTNTPIQSGTTWSPLGSSSGDCWDSGCGYTGWIQSTYVLPATGNYRLEYGVTNWDDDGSSDMSFNSGMAISNVVLGGVLLSGTNTIPVADAGPDQDNVASGAIVTLSGSGTDADDDDLTYSWTQTGGTTVTLSGATTKSPTFSAPPLATGELEAGLTFSLRVNDGTAFSDADTVKITVIASAKPVSNIDETAGSASQASAMTSGEVIVDVVADAGAQGFSDAPQVVTSYGESGAMVILGGKGRASAPGIAAIDALTMEDRKAMRARSGGSVPGLFAYADDGGAAASDAVNPARFQAWASLRYTHLDTSATLNNLEGGQWNGLAGLNIRMNPSTVLGVFTGYEAMSFVDDGASEFGGNGFTGGVYGLWQPQGGLRFDTQVSATRLGYEADSGGVTGEFDATRIIAAAGLTGTMAHGAYILEPSLRGTAVWENQDGYTDSAAVVQDARAFHFGKIAAGMKVSTTVDLGDGKSISPYAGGSIDYRYSGGDTTATLEAMDDVSATLNAGFNAKLSAATTLALDGNVSGLGLDDVLLWSARARLGVGF